MSIQAFFLIALHGPLLYWLVAVDRFESWNRKADWIEANVFPPWFRWDTQGDKVTWVQHGLTALLVSLYAGGLSFLTPESFAVGAAIGGWIAFVCFAIREGMKARERRGKPYKWTHPSPGRVGWAVDGLMDTVGPLIVAVGWTVAVMFA